MIARLTGTIAHAHGTTLVVETGGVGYRVFATPDTVTALRDATEPVSLWTHFAVRDTAQELYGFLEQDTLTFFEMLISVSGVGPKSALAIVSIEHVDTLKNAIRGGDHTYLTKVSGIGKKSAERIVIELRDKLGALEAHEEASRSSEDTDVFEALTALGYSQTQARDALKQVNADTVGTDNRLREALKMLG